MKRFRPNITKYFLLIITILVFIFVVNIFTEKTLKISQNQVSEIGGSFVLIDSDKQIFNSKNLKKKKIVYFGYTFCPDVCPLDLAKLSEVYNKFTKLKNSVQPIFISLDPLRDRPNVLKSYLENFNPNIIGLTGNEEDINKIIKKFKIYRNMVKSEDDDYYTIDHTSLFYLLDSNDKYLTHFGRKDFIEEFTEFAKDLTVN